MKLNAGPSLTDRQTDYLSKENTTCLKGLFAVCVLAHHLYQHSGIFREGWLRYVGVCFQALGFISVAIFFFLSGYGLLASYGKKPQSIQSFVKNKILPFYIINVLLVVIYSLFRVLIGQSVSLDYIVKSLTFGGTMIANGWYVQVQLLYYIMFYLVFRNRKTKSWLPLMLFLHCVYVVACIAFGLSSLYYERTLIFVFGMIWAEKRIIIDEWAEKGGYILWGTMCVLFVGSYVLSCITLPVLFRGLSYFFLIPTVMLLIRKINIRNAITKFFGSISLEIYVLQGVFLTLFHSNIVTIENPYLYIAVVSATTILSAFLIRPLFRVVYNICRKKTNPF